MASRSRNWRSTPAPPERARVTALSQALDLAQAPRLAAHMRRQPLPRDVVDLIRLAGGCRETLAAAAAATRREPDFLVAAAELYLRQVVCFAGADPYRTLGVCAQTPSAEIGRHMRELVRWLHPDRNPQGGDRVLMQRVLDAWQAVGRGRAAAPPDPVPSGLGTARHRRTRSYRPAWIPLPLPEARSAPGFGQRWRRALQLALVAAGLVIPCAVPIDLSGLAAGPTRERHEAGIAGFEPRTLAAPAGGAKEVAHARVWAADAGTDRR